MDTPVKAEALNQDVTFTFDGESYTITSAAEWDLDALEAFEDQKVVTCVRLILGADQYKRFKTKRRTVGQLNAMFVEMQRALVGDSGN